MPTTAYEPWVSPSGAVPGQSAPIANRFLGRFDGNHPTGASFLVGDWTTDYTTPGIWLCTAAGNPGTWTNIAAGGAVSSVFGRTGAVVATSGDYTAAQVTNAADKSSASAQDFTGEVSAPDLEVNGLTGAANPIRWVGGNASGAPASGTFEVRDGVTNTDGTIWVCTVAGSPGTWTHLVPSPLTTKGDLWIFAGADQRFGVGSDTQVLTADSTQISGLSWKGVVTGQTQIAQTVLGSDTATFDFTSIPGTYTDLMIALQARDTTGANSALASFTFNADTGNNYSDEADAINNGTFTVNATGQARANMRFDIAAASALTSQATGWEFTISNYARSTFFKNIFGRGSVNGNNASNFSQIMMFAGIWASTAAITRVTITAQTLFKAGSIATLYGRL